MSIDNSHHISDIKVMLVKGIDGVGIEKIEKTGTSGLVDTYTITYTDSRKTTFTVTNGNGITSVAKTATSGLVDTYTITFDDGSTETFNITNGRGITKIEKTSTVGNVDTYTITYNDGTTSTYDVTNGAGSSASGILFTDNGEGATNVQDAVDNVLELVAPIQLTLTADKTYNAGDQFVYEGLLYEVTSTIASGGTITIGSNCNLAPTVAEQLSTINSNLSACLPSRDPDITISGTTYTTFGAQLEQLSRVVDFSKITAFSTLKIEDYILSNARISVSGGTPSGIHYGSISVSGTSLTPVGCYITSSYTYDFIRATMGTSTTFTSLKTSSVGGLDLKFWY